MTFERITTDPEVLGGVPCMRGSRVPVATVVGMIPDGITVEEALADLTYLEPDDIAEALRYAAEAVRERELQLRPVGSGSWSTRACRLSWFSYASPVTTRSTSVMCFG